MAKKKYIETPERLLEMWDEYKAHVDSNPDRIQKATNMGVQDELVKQPYLRQGFESFVFRKYGFNVCQYLDNQDNAYGEYLGVITCMRREWENDQIAGTLTGRYKAPNLVARLNGLTEKTESKQDVTLKSVEVKIVPPNAD